MLEWAVDTIRKTRFRNEPLEYMVLETLLLVVSFTPPWERLMPSESVLFGSDLILSYLVLYDTNHWVSVFASWRLEALTVKIGWVDFNDMWLACLWHSILGCILTICSMIHFQMPVLGSSLEMKMWLDALQDLLKGHVVLCLAGYLSLFLNLFCFFPLYCCCRMRYSWASSHCLFFPYYLLL